MSRRSSARNQSEVAKHAPHSSSSSLLCWQNCRIFLFLAVVTSVGVTLLHDYFIGAEVLRELLHSFNWNKLLVCLASLLILTLTCTFTYLLFVLNREEEHREASDEPDDEEERLTEDIAF